jgi:hypothetical protein
MKDTRTRAELIEAIKVKVKGADPMTYNYFVKELKRAKKSRLQTILRKARVTKGKYHDIDLT